MQFASRRRDARSACHSQARRRPSAAHRRERSEVTIAQRPTDPAPWARITATATPAVVGLSIGSWLARARAGGGETLLSTQRMGATGDGDLAHDTGLEVIDHTGHIAADGRLILLRLDDHIVARVRNVRRVEGAM